MLTVLLVGAVGFWSGRATFAPPDVAVEADDVATVEVTEATVGRFLPMVVSASWPTQAFGVGAGAGTLTRIEVTEGQSVRAGSTLYSVDLRPVVAAQGDVPAFRDMAQGVRGDDVAQLQRLLITTGFLRAGADDGVFGATTTRAVRAWQRQLGVGVDGVVRAGDVLFAPVLPARVRLTEGVRVGDRLAPGDVVLDVLATEPVFDAVLVGGAAVPDASVPLEVTVDGEQVSVVVAGTSEDLAGNTLARLVRPDGSAVCGEVCETVPLDPSNAVFPARRVLVPPASGPSVPAAAVGSNADGDAFVLRDDGTRVPVTVLAAGDGRVVLDGVEIGWVLRIPEETE